MLRNSYSIVDIEKTGFGFRTHTHIYIYIYIYLFIFHCQKPRLKEFLHTNKSMKLLMLNAKQEDVNE